MIEQTIIDITNRQLSKNDVRITDELERLKIDSLSLVELVMAFEEKFGIEITDEEFVEFTGLKCIADLVKKRIE